MRGILFDNDGTLVDTRDIILASLRYSTRTVLDREIPDEVLMRKVGQPLGAQVKDFTPDEREREELMRVYRAHNATIHDERIRAFPGTREALGELAKRGHPLGVVTSKLHVIAWRGLELCGLAPFFECCVGLEDCERFKPDPEPVLRGAEALGLPAGECAYVGDSPFDIQAGRAAGCTTVAVTWGVFSERELAAESPDFMCTSWEALLDALA